MAKRSVGISIFGMMSIFSGTIAVIGSIIPLILSLISAEVRKLIFSQITNYLNNLIFGIIILLCGIGLLKLKWWARIIAISIALFSIPYGIYGLYFKLTYPIFSNNIFLVINIVSILLYSFALWYFNKPSIKEQFSPSTV